MNSYAQTGKKDSTTAELIGQKRQEKALREFKEVLDDLVLMFRKATGVETVCLYWINRARRQFVMETKATTIAEVVFQDRVGFEDHFLNEYKDIQQPVSLKIGQDIDERAIAHYYDDVLPVEHLTLLPFTNNEETVAITVLESANEAFSDEQTDIIHSYINALGNVLNTYLEISDLYENQGEWVRYEESLSFLNKSGHSVGLLTEMLETMQQLVGEGSVSFVASGMGAWVNVLNSSSARRMLQLGIPMEKRTVAWDALKHGQPEFAIHFNKNPKRISPRELYTEGATLAIPMIFNDQRKGLVLVYEQNPLIFKESTKHKLINIVRLVSLKIGARLNRKEEDRLLTNEYDAFIPDVWERAIDGEIERLQAGNTAHNTWVGLVTLENLSEIRTKFRLEELKLMQKDLVQIFNPGRVGIPGFVGFHADYVYLVMLQSKDPNAINHWKEELQEQFKTPVELTNGKEIYSGLNIGTIALNEHSKDSYNVISEVRRALSNSIQKFE